MAQHPRDSAESLNEQIISFGRHIAGPCPITAACICGGRALGPHVTQKAIEVLFVIRGFQPKLMNYARVFGEENTVVAVAVDEWVFERDVDRGFLGEALAWGLIFPYLPLINKEYLHLQEVRLKKRLILELLENLVLAFPELSYELHIKPEYFMYEAMLRRARLFPPMMYSLWNFTRESSRKRSASCALQGYLEALRELEGEGAIRSSNSYVQISGEFVERARRPRTRLVNLSKIVPRALFTSTLGIFQQLLSALSQNREMLLRLQRTTEYASRITYEVEVPERYVYVPTASGLVPLANRTDIESFARKVLSAGQGSEIAVKTIGGFLNDVYLVEASVNDEEKKVVVKRFKDWSSFKWFPLALWSIGTRTFAVLALSRLERECAINQLLHSKGFSVPRLLHVSADKRLVFMEYLEGENASRTIKKIAGSRTSVEKREGLIVIEKIGREFAKVHALGIALGDTKPENILVGEHDEIYLMDFEQASRGGDRAWDVAEFLYYAGHDIPPIAESRKAELIANAFVSGYLAAGGDAEVVRKAGNPKYTKVFSVFTLPHIILAISNVCRKTYRLKG